MILFIFAWVHFFFLDSVMASIPKVSLKEKIELKKKLITKWLKWSRLNDLRDFDFSEESWRLPRKKVLSRLVRQQLRGLGSLQAERISEWKGQLILPVEQGQIISQFGRFFDARTGLYVFKKGVDIAVKKRKPVKAIFRGKVVYSGVLPTYGRVVIIDHGEHYYSLCAHLGQILKTTNETVALGDQIGLTDSWGGALYFEMRSRNVALNPLQWLMN